MLILRSQKGSELTHEEMDRNLIYSSNIVVFKSLIQDGYGNSVIDSVMDGLYSVVTPSDSLSFESVTSFADGTRLGYIKSDILSNLNRFKYSSPLDDNSFEIASSKDFILSFLNFNTVSYTIVDNRYEYVFDVFGNHDSILFIFPHPNNDDFTISKVVIPT